MGEGWRNSFAFANGRNGERGKREQSVTREVLKRLVREKLQMERDKFNAGKKRGGIKRLRADALPHGYFCCDSVSWFLVGRN